MNKHFEIIDGVVYLNKSLYTNSLQTDNDISKLIGSTCTHMFRIRPKVQCGIETVTIDYADSDNVMVDEDLDIYIHDLQEHYHNRVRGHLVVMNDDGIVADRVINDF